MKRFDISQIRYNTSGLKAEPEETISLPKSMTIYCDSEEEIADTISDGTDFLVEGFVIDSVEDC